LNANVDGPRTLPFDGFLDLLGHKGYGVSLHEYAAVATLLSRWDGVSVVELGDALGALIGRSDEEVEGIRRLFVEIYAPTPPSPPPPAAPVDRWLWLRSRAWVLAVGAAVILVVAVVMNWPSPSLPAGEVTSVVPSVFTATATEAVPLPPPPAPALPAPPKRVDRPVLAGAIGGSFLLALAGFWLLKLREARRLWLQDAWASLRATLPGPFDLDEIVRKQPVRLPKSDVEDAATLLGRVFSRVGLARELDVRLTIRATLRRGLMPTLVTKPRRVSEPIVVLQDVCQEMRLWEPKLQAFLGDFRRQGIALQMHYFDGDLSRVSERPHRPASSIESVIRRRPDVPVMILSSAAGLPAMLAAPDRTWLRLLGRRPRTTWLTPVADVRLWPAELSELPIDVWPMTRQGLANAARQLADVNATFGPLTREQIARDGYVTREDVERLKRLASLVPQPSPALLNSLRGQFAPDVSDAAILHLMNEADGPSAPIIKLPDEEVRDNANVMRRESPDLEEAARTAILQVLLDSEPIPGSLAHERWQIAVQTQRLQLADLRGSSAGAAAAVDELRRLAQGPIGLEVTEVMRLVPGTTEMTERRDRIEKEQRKLVTPSIGRQRMGVRRLRWSWPGLREVVPAAIAAGVVLLASIGLTVLPARAVEHVTEAYGLEYVAQPSSSTPLLNLSLARQDAAVPRRVDLYRAEKLFQSGISLSGAAPTGVQLRSEDTGYHYQVRGRLPADNLAVSPWVWVTSDKLSFLLIDASPWANVTISGGQGTSGVQETPFTAALLPGTYQLQFENPALGAGSVVNQTLSVPSPTPSIYVKMPNFEPDQAVDTLLPPAGAAAR
jgi:hypothetical protein